MWVGSGRAGNMPPISRVNGKICFGPWENLLHSSYEDYRTSRARSLSVQGQRAGLRSQQISKSTYAFIHRPPLEIPAPTSAVSFQS